MKWDQLEVGNVASVNHHRYVVLAVIEERDDQTGYWNRNERILAYLHEDNTVDMSFQITLNEYNVDHYRYVDIIDDKSTLTLSSASASE